MVDLKDRFLKYVSFDTQSDETSETFPSTEKQKVLLKYLVEEMKSLGLTEVEMDEHSYAMGYNSCYSGIRESPGDWFYFSRGHEPGYEWGEYQTADYRELRRKRYPFEREFDDDGKGFPGIVSI